jgi:ATP-dependent helicase/nuclease subunit B
LLFCVVSGEGLSFLCGMILGDGSSSGAPGVTRVFLGWDKPLIPSLAQRLAAGWSGVGALDLSDTLVVVPTRNASRRLREALAAQAATHGAAVLPPLTVTPDFLSAPARLADVVTAGSLETLLVWASVLMKLDLEEYRELFPVNPVERNASWALKMAEDVLEVREALNEVGLSLASAAKLLAESDMEPARWQNLAALEMECVEVTRAAGLEDWQEARRAAAVKGTLQGEVKRIVMGCVLDPSGLALQALERLSRFLPVEVVIFAPEDVHGAGFDAWGRPVVEYWMTQEIKLEPPLVLIHPEANPEAQAQRVVKLLADYERPGDVAGIGVADAEVTAPLEKELERRGVGTFDPAGHRLGTHGALHVLRLIQRLASTRDYRAVGEFLRCPDVIQAIRAHVELKTGEKVSAARLLNESDELEGECLPDTLDDALELGPRLWAESGTGSPLSQSGKQVERPEKLLPSPRPYPAPAGEGDSGGILRGVAAEVSLPLLPASGGQVSPLSIALPWLAEHLAALDSEDFANALMRWLGEIFAERRFRNDHADAAVYAVLADQIAEVLETLDGPLVKDFPGRLSAGQRLDLLVRALEDEPYHANRHTQDVELQGWLELLWEDAPHLIVTGMNEGMVPDAIQGHAYLPDSARRKLGLRHNDTRLARDACLLATVVGWRGLMNGRVDLVFGRVGAGDEPLRPSRLLFQCGEEQLASRALELFQKLDRHVDPMPWTLAWKLKPRVLPDEASLFKRIAVTQFRSYLSCPFRFYLSRGLGMSSVEVGMTEMDAMQFGDLVHGVLEQFGNDETLKASADEKVIREAFHDILDSRLNMLYGARLTVPVMIQRESARQRLGWWATLEADQRQQGWRIHAVEHRLGEGKGWPLGGMIISGKVDRIEVHQATQVVRLIDFKTSKGQSVKDYHLTKLKKTEADTDFPAWSVVEHGGEMLRWTDLQLPLYQLALAEVFEGKAITTAHVSLGKTKADVALHEWPELDNALLTSAKSCAEGVIQSILERRFWPPAERTKYQADVDDLFFGDVLTAVEGEWLK